MDYAIKLFIVTSLMILVSWAITSIFPSLFDEIMTVCFIVFLVFVAVMTLSHYRDLIIPSDKSDSEDNNSSEKDKK